MKPKAGMWIDHKKAIVITMNEKGEEMQEILSDVETQPRRSGDSPMKGHYESLQVPADDRRQKNFTGQINIYYDAVISSLGDAESVLIFGPGQAKDELRERLQGSNRNGLVIEMETVDKMTEPQIAAKIHQYFAK
ncbi:MAG: hypothetical protein WCP16_18910 [Pseudanabaena sp. ELA645]|jgi:hypothetical protein